VAAFLDRWHWVWLLAAAPFLLFPSPARSLALLVVPLVWLFAWKATGKPLPQTPLNAILLVMSVMILVSLLATYDMTVSLPKIAGMVLAFGVFFAVARESRSTRGLWLILAMFFGTGAAVAGLGLLGTNWSSKFSFLAAVAARLQPQRLGLSGAQGGFNPNEVAGALLWVLPVAMTLLAWLIVRRGPLAQAFGQRRVYGLIVVSLAYVIFLLGVFVLAQSRSGLIALGVTGLGLLSFPLWQRRRWKWLCVLWVGASLAALLAWPLATAGGSDINIGNGVPTSLGTLGERVAIWTQAIYAIRDFPFTGMGMNTFRYVARVMYPPFSDQPNFDPSHAHNEFLQAAIDLGLAGLIAFVGLHIATFTMLMGLGSKKRIALVSGTQGEEPQRAAGLVSPGQNLPLDLTPAFALALTGGLIAHLVYGMTDAVALGAKPGFLFWVLLGLIVGLYQRNTGDAPAPAS